MDFQDYRWFFQNGCRKNIGINNGNIEMFLDTPIVSLGREICQNSGDARRDKTKPVQIEFKTIKFKTSNLPDIDELQFAINQENYFGNHRITRRRTSFMSAQRKRWSQNISPYYA